MNKTMITLSILLIILIFPVSSHGELTIWANNGQDKITKDELRATSNADSVVNSVWDRQTFSKARGHSVLMTQW